MAREQTASRCFVPVSVLLVAALTLHMWPLQAQEPPSMRDTTAYASGPVGLRAEPQFTAPAISQLVSGTKVHVSTCTNGWCAVTAGTQAGYVPSEFLTLCANGPCAVTAAPSQAVDSIENRPAARTPRRRSSAVVRGRTSESHPGTVKVEFDRFKDQTVATLDGLKLSGGLELTVFYIMPGETPSVPTDVQLMLTASGDDWQYLYCFDVSLLIDGRPLAVPNPEHDGRVGEGYVLEFVTFSLRTADFLRLAGAQQVEGRLCRTEFLLDGPKLMALRDLASRMEAH